MSLPELDENPHTAVQLAVRAVQRAFWGDGDLRAAWPLLDPLLRRCWVMAWLAPQRGEVRRLGYDPDDVVEAFVADYPRHRLWSVFECGQVTFLEESAPADITTWGISAEPTVVGVDMELLALWPVPEDGTDQVADDAKCVPFLMRYDDEAGWRLLNFFSMDVPVPGWPPAW
ncbi:hypothetical protein [Actinacidiphila acidipaludis]|uniref:Uncharacterized protein n=1 Tax=Actinacidiphila acidipaludis TaxID=2873382 RepID=A0ABS7Q9A4_9ACTN|nr:hypothetical protein [Streptomyces acidipaludis]MBY8879742.1 hypothetical protein [Streptomyces acidipaludis]